MFIVSFLTSLEIPVRHAEQEDGLDLDALTVPGVGEDDSGVGVSCQEHLEQLAQQLLSQQSDGRIDLEKTKNQDIRTTLSRKCQQLSNLIKLNI